MQRLFQVGSKTVYFKICHIPGMLRRLWKRQHFRICKKSSPLFRFVVVSVRNFPCLIYTDFSVALQNRFLPEKLTNGALSDFDKCLSARELLPSQTPVSYVSVRKYQQTMVWSCLTQCHLTATNASVTAIWKQTLKSVVPNRGTAAL